MNEQLFNKLKSASDIAPDKHDGSYELVQKTVEAYASMDSLNSIDYKDLDLIYYMAVGSWKKHGISFDKKLFVNRASAVTISAFFILIPSFVTVLLLTSFHI